MIANVFQQYPENLAFQLFIILFIIIYNISNLPVKFAIFLKSSLLFNSFYCLFCLQTKLYGSVT